MNKVFLEGWIYHIQSRKLPHDVDEVKFNLKTKIIVGKKETDKPEYDYIPCYAKGKKATNIIRHLSDDSRVYVWGRFYFDNGEKVTIAVDEIEFL